MLNSYNIVDHVHDVIVVGAGTETGTYELRVKEID